MKAYFDRSTAFFLRKSPSFDGVPVEVDEQVLSKVLQISSLMDAMKVRIYNAASPERSNQELSDYFTARMNEIMKPTRSKKNGNK